MAAKEGSTWQGTKGGLFAVIDETKNSDSREKQRKNGEQRSRRASFNLGDETEFQTPSDEEDDPEEGTFKASSVEGNQLEPVALEGKVEGRKLSEPVLGSVKVDMSTRKLSFPDVIARRSAFSEKRKKLSKGKLGRGEKQRRRQAKGLGPRGRGSDLIVYYKLRDQDSREGKGDPEGKGIDKDYRIRRKSCIPKINIENCHSSNEGEVFKSINVDTSGPLPTTPNSTEFTLVRPRRDSRVSSPRLRISSSYSSSPASVRSSRATSRNSRVSEYESFGTPSGSMDQEMYFSATSLNSNSPELRSCSSKSPSGSRVSRRQSEDHRLGTELSPAGQNLRRFSSPVLSRKQSNVSLSSQSSVRLKGCSSEMQLSACTHELVHKTSLPNLSASSSLVKLSKVPSPAPSGSQISKKLLGNSQISSTRFSIASKEEYMDVGENECQSKFGRILSIICVLFFISYLIIIYNHFASMTRAHEQFKYYTFLEEEQRVQEFVVQIDIS